MPEPVIIVSVSSDLTTDQRVHRSCLALQKQGFEVFLVGRKLPRSPELDKRNYKTKRLNLFYYKGPLFYASFNIRLFLLLCFNKADALFANDLDTLLPNYLASRLKRIPLVYDSHEFYTGVPELENRPFVRNVWLRIEKWIFPKLKTIITVNDSIASLYKKLYNKNLIVIRNVPVSNNFSSIEKNKNTLRKKLNLPAEKNIIILQGSGINIQRGAEEAVEAMRYLESTVLIILGGGDVISTLKLNSKKEGLENKIIFLPRMNFSAMMEYTAASDIGLTLDKDTNINYRYSLPNKIFDYINAGIPILASRLPEIEKIINHYQIGCFIENHQPQHIASQIKMMFANRTEFERWEKNTQLATLELNWEKEEEKFPDIIHELH